MIERPQTHYTSLGDADIVYQVMGDGPVDLLFFFGLGFSTQTAWQVPTFNDFCRRLAPFSRLIFFDRRGVGGSDAVPHDAMLTWEGLAEDAGAVLDSLRTPRATIYATLEGGPMALLFAATHPDRVSALLLVNTTARYLVAEPAAPRSARCDLRTAEVKGALGTRWIGAGAFAALGTVGTGAERTRRPVPAAHPEPLEVVQCVGGGASGQGNWEPSTTPTRATPTSSCNSTPRPRQRPGQLRLVNGIFGRSPSMADRPHCSCLEPSPTEKAR